MVTSSRKIGVSALIEGSMGENCKMTQNPKFCQSCGGRLEESPAFCPSCGSSILSRTSSEKRAGVFARYWRQSVKGRIFYGAWILLNVSNGLNLIVVSSAPKDRFRNVCNWEGVNCAPSAEEQAIQSLFNLVLLNLLFWGFRTFYRKKQLMKGNK